MSLSIANRVVVFDYGEVISVSPSAADRAVIEQIAGTDALWHSYWVHRDALDGGRITPAEYWRAVASDLGVQWGAATVHALWVADFRSWLSVEPGTIDLIERLHAGGTRVALLSNAGFDYAAVFRISPMAQYFERMFVSAEMNKVKPDSAIYHEVCEGLGITIDQMVFIDNRSINTDAAAALGATVHHVIGVDGLGRFLESLAA